MSLDPPLTPQRLREVAAARQVERYGTIVDPSLVFRQADPPVRRQILKSIATGDLGQTCLVTATRTNDMLQLSFAGPPRTKKNHGQYFGVKQSKAYLGYRGAIIAAIVPVKAVLELPLPSIEYNCRAIYYVDGYGEPADLNGLNQGLHDALENAGVLLDDWWIRQVDGTRIVFKDPQPRVDVWLTPLGTPEAGEP